ncbi:MAG: ABC transporter ATP-binding protein, partial [Lachnospiraceae bacterium]|nr:ABC transporter ATP-binding protein [Lachnospiraceae bacterium]
VQVILLSVGLLASLISVAGYWDDIAKLGTIIGEVTDIIEQPDLVRPTESKTKPDKFGIFLQNVTFGYHEKEVLHGINMEIEEGTINAFVGPSGSGKSTVAKLIASLWDVKGGSIKIGGVDVKDMSLTDYNKYVAYVSQDNFLFDETIMENIRMGKQGATNEEVIEAAKKCGCHDFIMGLEKGYETIVGGAGGHLSGGERQRICIARAMLKDAPIVILDEATAYTDPENEAIIQAAVAKLVRGKTLIVIAHRLSTITDSDKIFVIEHGRVNSCGTHEELLKMGGLYASMWKSHIAVKDISEGGNGYV